MLEYRSNVLLPRWIWEEARDKQQFKQFVLQYIRKNYPHYKVIKINGHFAVCVRK